MSEDKLINEIKDLKEDIYYVSGRPQLSPSADRVNECIDKVISIIRRNQETLPSKITFTVDAHVEFWKAEYKALARAGVERMAEFGIQVDPAEKMIASAEYREKKILGAPYPKRESGEEELRKLKIVPATSPEERAHNHAGDSCISILRAST